jgi:hypothetical protein
METVLKNKTSGKAVLIQIVFDLFPQNRTVLN